MVNLCLRLQNIVNLTLGDMQGTRSSTNECMHFPIHSKPFWTEAMILGNDSVEVGNEE